MNEKYIYHIERLMKRAQILEAEQLRRFIVGTTPLVNGRGTSEFLYRINSQNWARL